MPIITKTLISIATLVSILIVSVIVSFNLSLRLFLDYSFAAFLISFVILTPTIGCLLTFGTYRLFLKKQIPKIGRISDGNVLFLFSILLLLVAAYLISAGVL